MSWFVLRRAGVAVVLDTRGSDLPRIAYWGADLGELSDDDCATLPGASHATASEGASSTGALLTLSPSRAQGWAGWPGCSGHRSGMSSQPLFVAADVTMVATDVGDVVGYRGVDEAAALRLDGELELTAEGVLRHRQTMTSTATNTAAPYVVDDILTLLPVPELVAEVADYAGRWGDEAQLQRRELTQGTWLREQRRGRTGPDSPLLLMAGTAGFGHRDGEVWGIHLGWSGDQRYLAQRLNSGDTLIGAGEILQAGEVILGPGESMSTPWVYATYSNAGIDGASDRLHAWLRRRPEHPQRPRPILLNSWEAVFFDHSFERLAALADAAAEIGVERFVVDDGWFGSRRTDTSGLGDWYVSPDVWPEGLGPIADHVRARGMEFGLWFEPEMVNLDSDVAREHPEWVLGAAGRMPPPRRHQQVLDVANPDAYAYLLERISTLVQDVGIAYIKWDHNRDVADPVHRGGPRAGLPAMRALVLAAYRLMAELKERHPGLEIESCSSGGSRIDFGVLAHTDRVWPSDCIDPLERVRIVQGVATLLPLELIGAHVASGRSHTTGRTHDLSFRLAVAAFGHTGFEWDLTATRADERRQLARYVAFVKSIRDLLRTGLVVRVDRPADPGLALYGVVSPDRSEALFNAVRVAASPREGAAPLRFRGLDPALRYRVERVELPGSTPAAPVGGESVTASGRQLQVAGMRAPELRPEQAALYHLRAVSL